MKDIFVNLLLTFQNLGKITEANMWSNISNIHIEGEDCKYIVSIRKEPKDEVKENA